MHVIMASMIYIFIIGYIRLSQRIKADIIHVGKGFHDDII